MQTLKAPRLTPIEKALSRLTSGHGAQKLPSSLQRVEITNVPSRGMRKGQREFLKTILPRIKYHNAQLEVVTNWHRLPDRKGKNKQKEEVKDSAPDQEAAASVATIFEPVIRLHFDGLPSQELPMKNVSVTDITREMLTMIQSTTKSSFELEDESKGRAEDSTDIVDESAASQEEVIHDKASEMSS